jgi:hypothetical protein
MKNVFPLRVPNQWYRPRHPWAEGQVPLSAHCGRCQQIYIVPVVLGALTGLAPCPLSRITTETLQR